MAAENAASAASLKSTKRTRCTPPSPFAGKSASSRSGAQARTASTAMRATSCTSQPYTPALTAGKATERAPSPVATSSERVKQDASCAGSVWPACRSGPTVWITQRAWSSPAPVATASPTGRPPGRPVRRTSRHSARSAGPAAAWIAPSTPPPPSSEEFAALTMASTRSVVMSPRTASMSIGIILPRSVPTGVPTPGRRRRGADRQGGRCAPHEGSHDHRIRDKNREANDGEPDRGSVGEQDAEEPARGVGPFPGAVGVRLEEGAQQRVADEGALALDHRESEQTRREGPHEGDRMEPARQMAPDRPDHAVCAQHAVGEPDPPDNHPCLLYTSPSP